MQKATRQQIAACIRQIGLIRGDNVLIHSAVQYLGYPEGGVGIYLEALQDVLVEGTIAVPTFNFDFARGKAYDPLESPSQSMGAFSEFIRKQPESRRTLHPMQSLAFLGPLAADLASRNTPSAFDPGSAFEGMLDLGFKLLLLGADIQSVSMVHYCEQRAGVPYRYWKEFSGSMRVRFGANADSSGWQVRTYRMFVRDLELNPQLQLSPIQALLVDRGQWSETHLNYGLICSCRLADFVKSADDLLAADPWALIENPPQNCHV
jgi:aminoglycoside 3-N-acetyltransferase